MHKSALTFGLLASSLVMLAIMPFLNQNNSFSNVMAQEYGDSSYSTYQTDDKKYECQTGPFEGFFVSSVEFCKHVKFHKDDGNDINNDNRTGTQGTPGPAGPQGLTGPQGERGLTGLTGPAGPVGTVPGPQGEQGLRGFNGTNGVNGAPGTNGLNQINLIKLYSVAGNLVENVDAPSPPLPIGSSHAVCDTDDIIIDGFFDVSALMDLGLLNEME